MKIDVLDHGYCRMTSYTQPADQVMDPTGAWIRDPNWTGDLEIVRAARTSYNADWRPDEETVNGFVRARSKDEKLIHRLWKDGHTSPFEAMSFTFEVQAPLFVFRQWHRHRTQSYSEVSARYTEMPDLFYIPKDEHVQAQSKSNKQGREEGLHYTTVGQFKTDLIEGSKHAYNVYQFYLEQGVSRELARMVLPVNIYSRMYATSSLLNWFRFLKLRLDPHAQYEIRVYAEAILEHLKKVCPISVAAFQMGMPALGTEFNPHKVGLSE